LTSALVSSGFQRLKLPGKHDKLLSNVCFQLRCNLRHYTVDALMAATGNPRVHLATGDLSLQSGVAALAKVGRCRLTPS